MTDIDHYESAVQSMFRAAATSKKLDRSALVEAILAVVVELRHLRDQQPTEQVTDLSARVARLESLAASPDWGLTEDERDDLDTPRVCVTHQRHIPCRHGSDDSPCERSDRPEDVERVRQHHAESGPVRPCEATSPRDDLRDPSGLEGREKGAEPLTEEPPVGSQVVDSDPFGMLKPDDIVRRTNEGYEWWTGSEWEATTDWRFLSHPVRLATDADRERVGLPRDQWPSTESDRALDELRDKLTQPRPRTLADDEIAVKVPASATSGAAAILRMAGVDLKNKYWLGSGGLPRSLPDWLDAIADALEAKEAGR